VEGFAVEDQFPDSINYSSALIRFVNASPNSQPLQLSARSSAGTDEVAVGGPVAYAAAGAFVALPLGSYDLLARTAGATTPFVTRTLVTLLPGRVYTITVRGDATLPSTGTAVNRPFLDNSTNR
jgi:hypothetical protein